jgi:two-component system cell cycle response regulator
VQLLHGRGYAVDVARSATEVLACLETTGYDVVLLAWALPDTTGLHMLRQVRATFAMPDLPVVILSCGDQSEDVVRAFDRGANEFLKIPIEPDVFLVRIHNLVALRRARLALRQQAMVDALTSVFNRRYAMEALRSQIAQAQRYGRDLSFCLCDIDNFKAVNDTHGHRIGDTALQLVATSLRQRLRRSDVVGRFGGDELCVILPETSMADAAVALSAVRQAIQTTPIALDETTACFVTASFGVAEIGDETKDISTLVARTDEALYAAKARGRNRICTAVALEPLSSVTTRAG